MDRVCFKVNGVEHTVGCEISSDVSLLEYLRRWLELRGTKYMCQEGGCGACVVSVAKHPGAPTEAVNACLVSVTSCHDWEITTIEKIGNRLKGYHPIQKCLYENHGSQCGYCSPGWVMAMYSLLKKKPMTMLEIEQSLASNTCRCTGYRPILEAFKKFAKDSPDPYPILDIEDLSICKKTGEICSNTCDESEWCVVSKDDVKVKQASVIHIKLSDNRDWYRVEDLTDVFRILLAHGTDSYMLVAGNTAKGAYPILEYPRLLIDISAVASLKGYFLDQNLVVGAGNTLTEVMEIFDRMCQTDYFKYLKIFNDHLHLVAHIPVKNIGTIAGNLMIKNRHNEFNSDVFLLFNAVGAELSILNEHGIVNRISMQNFLKENMHGKVILNVLLPPLNDEYKIVTYKIMPRSQNAHAIVHSGFVYKIDPYDKKVLDCRVVYGGLSPAFIRAIRTERYLIGRRLFTNETLQGAINVLDNEMVVTEEPAEPSVEYRRKLALSLFYKGLMSLCPPEILGAPYKSGAVRLRESRSLSDGKQIFETNPSLWPLNQPLPKVDGLLQCAGEAKYSDDIPSFPKEVFAAFVLSTVALGTIQKIDASKALLEPGVIAFYSASDIPGRNSFTPGPNIVFMSDEELLCEKEVKYYNQPLGIIVAETQDIANKAVHFVKVTYTNVRKPVLDIKVAKKDPKRNKIFFSATATKSGADIAKVIKGENNIYGQYHFCMETLVCVTHPIEEGLKVYAATQWIDSVHKIVSRVLKIQQNKIDVTVRRLGGAYGLKISRPNQVAGACSLVSYKLNRPCRFIQSLRTNMRAVGKRLPCSNDYEVAVNSQGVIQYNNMELYEDNGYVVNEPLTLFGVDIFFNCYDKSPWNFKVYDTVTDTTSNTWCRSPGTLENVANAEWLMERIAYEMNLDPVNVRMANLDTVNYAKDITELLNTLKTNSQYDERRVAVDKFNSENRWKKRGLRHSFLRWSPFLSPFLEVNLSVYVDDGTIVITHSGIEMGQGIDTKAVQMCAYYLKVPIEKVQIKANDSIISPNAFVSGASVTTQNVGIGIKKCCEELQTRLEPIKAKMDNPTWNELIKKASESEVDLQVHASTGIADTQRYDIYGVTLAEVEIDVLTGEWNIIRVDLIEDVGRSVNPEIDVGQVEGSFIMGLGYWTTEELKYDQDTGELLTDRTWNYKVPLARDIPQDFRIYFRKKSFSNEVILGAKATGEPATCMSVVVPIAMREAIVAARQEIGLPSNQWFNIDGPYTLEKICMSCATRKEDFKFY
ncbi:xanthine dehydrogenase 1-like [Colias croceus]|uniref:xanthine dehydrogenase 1-like n=1 Tax=Colias crocea TaxID=72248 RepID=UPI001E27E683|nr:xanthine dehydrogenase 1-like [Colias croceus]